MNRETIVKALEEEIKDDKQNWGNWYQTIMKDLEAEKPDDLEDVEM